MARWEAKGGIGNWLGEKKLNDILGKTPPHPPHPLVLGFMFVGKGKNLWTCVCVCVCVLRACALLMDASMIATEQRRSRDGA